MREENQSVGDQFKGALSDALESGDFKNLNRLIFQTVDATVNGTLSGVSKTVETLNGNSDEKIPAWQKNAMERAQRVKEKASYEAQFRQVQLRRESEFARQRQAAAVLGGGFVQNPPAMSNQFNGLVKVNKVGSVSNVLCKVFGGIGLTVFGILTLAPGLPLLLTMGNAVPMGIFSAFSLASLGMIGVGAKQGRMLRRADRYARLCIKDGKMFGEVSMLAGATGKSERFVRRDLQKILQKGMFPEGHLDASGTCFMLNDVVYGQYLNAEKGRKLRELEDQKRSELLAQAREVEQQEDPELAAMMREGADYIQKVRFLNDQIPGEEISDKLDQTQGLLQEIFDRVKEHPEQKGKIHKLQSYYLPTSIKLVESYVDLDRVSAPGAEILEAKSEILKTLDSINIAFTELLNNLFQSAAFDVTTDAQVLRTMLAKEGLSGKKDFGNP